MRHLKFRTFLFLLITCTDSYGQINHYWMSQIGARSNMLGGAVVGSVRDNSAIYYNPAGLAFIENNSFSVMGDAYYLDIVSFKNGAGDGVDLKSSSIEANPQLFSGLFKSKKRPWLTINYAIFNRSLSRTNLSAKNSGYYDVFSGIGGLESFYSTIEVTNETREDWAGVGYGYKINDRLGLGFSLFTTFFSQTHRENIDISIVDENNEIGFANLLGVQQSFKYVKINNVAILGKFGISYEYEKFQFGGTLTLPRVPLKIFSRSTINRSNIYYIPSTSAGASKKAYYQSGVSNYYKTPTSVDFGFKLKLNNNSKLYFTTAYFGAIEPYNIIISEPMENDVDSILSPSSDRYTSVTSAVKRVINVAIGYEFRFNEKFTMLYGFRTDFNNFNFDKVDGLYDFTPTFSEWDVYHLSGGANWKNDRVNLSLGLNTSYGRTKGTKQFVNLSNPTESNLLLGDLNNSVDAYFLRLTILVGFTYFFAMEGK